MPMYKPCCPGREVQALFHFSLGFVHSFLQISAKPFFPPLFFCNFLRISYFHYYTILKLCHFRVTKLPKAHLLTVSKIIKHYFLRKLHDLNMLGYASFLLKWFGFHTKINQLSVRINKKPFPYGPIFLWGIFLASYDPYLSNWGQNECRLKELESGGVPSVLREPDEPEILLFLAATQVWWNLMY